MSHFYILHFEFEILHLCRSTISKILIFCLTKRHWVSNLGNRVRFSIPAQRFSSIAGDALDL